MASVRKKDRSPFWFACFTMSDGSRTQRSTGTTDRKKAMRIAHEFEDAAREAAEGRFIESRARKVISDIFSLANRHKLPGSTTAEYLDAWVKRKEIEAGPRTHEKYLGVITQFKNHLGPKATRDIVNVSATDIARFRDRMAHRLAPGTCNVALKILRSAFAAACRDGFLDVNEAEKVPVLRRPNDGFQRRAFTFEELKRILEAAKPEWRGLILFGLYTGQRLGDIAALTWQNVDLQRHELRLVTEKTGRQQILPLATPLVKHLEALPSSDDPAAPLFPKAYATVERLGRASQLSNQFSDLLASIGLAKKKSHHVKPGEERGRSAKREMNPVSFHSLRHTATSLLKQAGVSDAVAMEFVGHESKSVSASYTHIDTQTLKAAVEKLPDVTESRG
jgi:integrase